MRLDRKKLTGFVTHPFIPESLTGYYEPYPSESRIRYRDSLGDRHLRNNLPHHRQSEPYFGDRNPGRLHDRISSIPEEKCTATES